MTWVDISPANDLKSPSANNQRKIVRQSSLLGILLIFYRTLTHLPRGEECHIACMLIVVVVGHTYVLLHMHIRIILHTCADIIAVLYCQIEDTT